MRSENIDRLIIRSQFSEGLSSDYLEKILSNISQCRTLCISMIKNSIPENIFKELAKHVIYLNRQRTFTVLKNLELNDIYCLDGLLKILGFQFLYLFEKIAINRCEYAESKIFLEIPNESLFSNLTSFEMRLRYGMDLFCIFQWFPIHFFSRLKSLKLSDSVDLQIEMNHCYGKDLFSKLERLEFDSLEFIDDVSLLNFFNMAITSKHLYHVSIRSMFHSQCKNIEFTRISSLQFLCTLHIKEMECFNTEALKSFLLNLVSTQIEELLIEDCMIYSDSLLLLHSQSFKFLNLQSLSLISCYLWKSSNRIAADTESHISLFFAGLCSGQMFPRLRVLNLSQNILGSLAYFKGHLVSLLISSRATTLDCLSLRGTQLDPLCKNEIAALDHHSILDLDDVVTHHHHQDWISSTSWGEYHWHQQEQ
jgi:hypothetical protein